MSNASRRSQIRRSMMINIGAVMLVFSSYNALKNLQSSLNIQEGLGTTSLAVFMGSTIFCGLFLSPVFLRIFSVKWGFVFCDLALLAYTAANFYPAYSTLIPTSVLGGMGLNMFWVGVGQLNIHFARNYKECGKQELDNYVSSISAYFFCGYLSTQLFGNLIPFVVFEIASGPDSTGGNISTAVTSSQSLVTGAQLAELSVSDYCGAKDCQDASLVGDSSQYRPASDEAIYVTYGIFAAMILVGLVLHVKYLPDVNQVDEVVDTIKEMQFSNPAFEGEDAKEEDKKVSGGAFKNEAYLEDESNNKDSEVVTSEIVKEQELAYRKKCRVTNGDVTEDPNNNNGKFYDVSLDRKVSNLPEETISDSDAKAVKIPSALSKPEVSTQEWKTAASEIWQLLKTNWSFYLKPMQMLLNCSQFIIGFQSAFAATEITRAYVSCVFGVAQVGICMAIFGALSLITALIGGKIATRIGRLFPILLGFILNFGVCIFCLLWIPEDNSSVWVVYVLLGFCGIIEGIYQTFSSMLVGILFPDETLPAYTAWAVTSTCGFLIQYAWSTSVCVEVKIYALIAVVAVSAVTYGLAEFLQSRKMRQNSEEERFEAKT